MPVVKSLIAAGAHLDQSAEGLRLGAATPLQVAARNGRNGVLEQLLAAGANVNLEADGDSALYVAAGSRGVGSDRLKLQVAAGADPTQRTSDGSYLLHAASSNPTTAGPAGASVDYSAARGVKAP